MTWKVICSMYICVCMFVCHTQHLTRRRSEEQWRWRSVNDKDNKHTNRQTRTHSSLLYLDEWNGKKNKEVNKIMIKFVFFLRYVVCSNEARVIHRKLLCRRYTSIGLDHEMIVRFVRGHRFYRSRRKILVEFEIRSSIVLLVEKWHKRMTDGRQSFSVMM